MTQDTFTAPSATATAMPTDIDRRIWALDFSEEEWLTILNTMTCQPSMRREEFRETLKMQVYLMPMSVADTALDFTGTTAPAGRIQELPWSFQVAILEVLERFWAGTGQSGTLEERLAAVGVCLHKSAHQKLEALRIQQHYAEA